MVFGVFYSHILFSQKIKTIARFLSGSKCSYPKKIEGYLLRFLYFNDSSIAKFGKAFSWMIPQKTQKKKKKKLGSLEVILKTNLCSPRLPVI